MKYIKSVEFQNRDNHKQLIIEITEEKALHFNDIYLLIESYRKKVDTFFICAVDGKAVVLTLDAKKVTAYDIKSILEKLV